MWEVEITDQFLDWWRDLTTDQQAALDVRVEFLAQEGPSLAGPPWNASRAPDITILKELRASEGGALRVLFMFDSRRHVILLLGGDKSSRCSEWYDWAVPAADDL